MTLRDRLIDLFYSDHWNLNAESVEDGKLVMEFKSPEEKVIQVSFLKEYENEQD